MILAKTVKGYGLGETAEGRKTAHQQKKLAEADLIKIRERFEMHSDFRRSGQPHRFCPSAGGFAGDAVHAQSRIEAMGGPLPDAQREADRYHRRRPLEVFHDALGGSRGREASTTAAFVSVLKTLMKHPEPGKLVVPDHSR